MMYVPWSMTPSINIFFLSTQVNMFGTYPLVVKLEANSTKKKEKKHF